MQAPKGRPITAQANGLGFRDQAIHQALKGHANTYRDLSLIPDTFPAVSLSSGFVDRPFSA